MNNVSLVGRITRDLELKSSNSGKEVLRFSIAVDRRFKNQETGEYEADFPSCVAFGQTAAFIAKYFRKGQRIGLTGRIQTGKYDKDGTTVYTTDVIVDNAEFVESKNSGESAPATDGPFTPAAGPAATELPFDL